MNPRFWFVDLEVLTLKSVPFLVLTVWPAIIAPPNTTARATTVIRSLLGALAVRCALGIRYPLQILPLLLFELLWKVIWVVAFALRMTNAARKASALGLECP